MLGSDWISLIILAFCVVLFVTDAFTMATTSVLGCILMVIFQVADFHAVFGQFSSDSVFLLISMMIMGTMLECTGVAHIIVHALIRISRGNERLMVTLMSMSCALLSAFLSNIATLSLFIALFFNLPRGQEKIDIRNFMLPLGMASVIGGAATLLGSAPQLSTQQFLNDNGYPIFGVFDYSYIGFPLVALLGFYIYFIGYPAGQKIWKDREGDAPAIYAECDEKELPALSSRGILAVLIFVGTVFLLFLEPTHMPLIACCGAAFSVIFHCISPQNAMRAVQWSSVIKLAGCLGILKAVSMSGGMQLLGKLLLGIAGGSPTPQFLLLVSIIITMLLSEFMTNSMALMIVLPSVSSICVTSGLSVRAYAMALTLACSMAVSCPLSNTSMTIVSTYGYRFSDFVRYNILWDVFSTILIFMLTPVFFPLIP